MYKGKQITVVMPAYNAEKTLLKTYNEVIAQEIVDLIIIVDDASNDETVKLAETLPKTKVFTHKTNKGYGANQKTCYSIALKENADIIIMVHPDYQYTPKLIPAMASLIANDLYYCVLGSRILGGKAVKRGMPIWRYIANRFLTLFENLFMGSKLSEFHTGYRAYSRELLEKIPFNGFSDDFLFDNQILAFIIWKKYTIAEISCPTSYFAEASSINLYRSVKYGFGCLYISIIFLLVRLKLYNYPLFRETK